MSISTSIHSIIHCLDSYSHFCRVTLENVLLHNWKNQQQSKILMHISYLQRTKHEQNTLSMYRLAGISFAPYCQKHLIAALEATGKSYGLQQAMLQALWPYFDHPKMSLGKTFLLFQLATQTFSKNNNKCYYELLTTYLSNAITHIYSNN